MPRYIGYRPQFNPLSLQEYLAVPTMLQQEYDTYEDKYNENLDKLAVLEGMLDDSTKNYLDAYKNNLNNAADIISGKSGNLSDLRQQTNSARQFYREYAPKLTNAYNKRQAALKAQQDILLKDPSAITTQVGNMQSFLDNPDQLFHSLSGDKIYADMINAGKLSAADVSNPLKVEKFGHGYLKEISQRGYTLAQQQEYANLVKQALNGDANAKAKADKMLKDNPIYAQPYQVLNKYIEDNKFNLFNDSEKNYALNKALSGQLMGMTGNTEEKLIQDRSYVPPSSSRKSSTSGSGGTDVTYPMTFDKYPTFIPSSLKDNATTQKIFSGTSKPASTGYISPLLRRPEDNTNYMFTQRPNTIEQPAQKDILTVAAETYRPRRGTNTGRDLETINTLAGRTGNTLSINNKDLSRLSDLGKYYNIGKYTNVEEIPQDVRNNILKGAGRSVPELIGLNHTGQVLHNKETEDWVLNYMLNNAVQKTPENNPSSITREEWDDLLAKGFKPYNPDGSIKSEEELRWSYYDIAPKAPNTYQLTGTQGAASEYAGYTLNNMWQYFKSGSKTPVLYDGKKKEITLTRDGDNDMPVGFKNPNVSISINSILKGIKVLTMQDEHNKEVQHHIRLTSTEKDAVDNMLNIHKAMLIEAYPYKFNNNTSNEDVCKAIDMGYLQPFGITSDVLMNRITQIILENSQYYIPKNSDTDSKYYKN